MTRFVAPPRGDAPGQRRDPASFAPAMAPPAAAAVAAAVVGLALLVGCPGSELPTADSLLEADRAFAAATARRGVDGWVEAFRPDGMQVSGAAVVEGHDAIREAMTPPFSDSTFSLEWAPEGARISDDRSLGYSWGRYTTRRGGEEETGRYLTVWRWEPERGWRVEADIGSPAP